MSAAKKNNTGIYKHLTILSRVYKSFFWLVPLFIFIYIFLWFLNYHLPLIGHDYSPGLPIFATSYWHFLKQGLIRFMYNPFLCGGKVMFGDPHDLYFSVFQLLFNFLQLWKAVQITISIMLTAGYFGWYFFGRQVINLPKKWSHLTALIIVTNGYYFSHIIVGHITYHTLPLAGWLFWLLFRKTENNSLKKTLLEGIIFSLFTAIMLYGGNWFGLLLTLIGFIAAAPLFLLLKSKSFIKSIRLLIQRSLIFGIFTLGISASKIVAVFSLMSHFPRPASPDTIGPQINTYLFTLKSLWAIPQSTKLFLGTSWALHEKSAFTSVVVILGLALIPVLLFIYRKYWLKHKILLITLCIYAVVVFYFMIQIIQGYGPVARVFYNLPILSSQHVTTRTIYPLAVGISIFGTWLLYALCKNFNKVIQTLLVIILGLTSVVLFFFAYKPAVKEFHMWPNLDEHIKADNTFRENIKSAVVNEVKDNTDFINKSNINCVDVLLMYHGNPQNKVLVPGPVTLEKDGYFNLMNPACYIYPEENNCQPGDRIKVEDRENFEAFRSGQPTTWKVSKLQTIADKVTLLTLIISVAIPLIYLSNYLRRKLKRI